MGNPKAFLTIPRKEAGYRPVLERIADFGEVEQTLNSEDRMLQASRCMDCGVPFCHWSCPVGNIMPEWQDAVYKGKWQEAYNILNTTMNFPEFTGRVCPALCEKSCVLKISENPVTIRENEAAVAERAFQEGYIVPNIPKKRTGKKIAIVGSGPAGLAAADILNQKGHSVTVFEKDECAGGLLRFGIPDFKLNKEIIDRRLNLMKIEGIEFKNGVTAGKDVKTKDLLDRYDAVCIAVGAGKPRDLPIEGRQLKGIYFALELLQQQNRIVAHTAPESGRLTARRKNVLVIGGGDTGSDCVGTSVRHRAAQVTQIEIMPKPPETSNPDTPWPLWQNVLRTSSSHLEGCVRRWNLASKRFIGDSDGNLTGVEVVHVEWTKSPDGRLTMKETDKTEILKADMALLSMGFVHPVHEGFLDQLNVKYDSRGNVATTAPYTTSVDRVFVAGDAATGASLVVRAIDSGRKAAAAIDNYLQGK
jgi:glutamate synthase (NADPH/NADH) small chain